MSCVTLVLPQILIIDILVQNLCNFIFSKEKEQLCIGNYIKTLRPVNIFLIALSISQCQ